MSGERRIGTDESGKGDYFGPLVVAAVLVRGGEDEGFLAKLGVRDSKKLSDRRVAEQAAAITQTLPHAHVTIGPAKYNDLYDRMGNLNRILAWAHARALENVLAKFPDVTRAVTDKFGDDAFVARALMERGRRLQLVQKVRAEEDPAVAAASVVARAEFLRRLGVLSAQAGVALPKGASAAVEDAARNVARARGRGYLRTVAKIHFKTTSRLGLDRLEAE